MSDLFLVTCLTGILLIVAGMGLAFLGDWHGKRQPPRSDDAIRRAQLDLVSRVGNGRKS